MFKKFCLCVTIFTSLCLFIQAQNQDIRKGGGSGSGVTVAAGTNIVVTTNGTIVTINVATNVTDSGTNYVALTNGWANNLTVSNGFNSLGDGLNTFIAVSNSAATGSNSIAIGFLSFSSGTNSVVAGWGATNTDAEASVTIGPYSLSSANNTVAIGNTAQATNTQSTALGNYAVAGALESTAVGNQAIAANDFSTAIGTGASTTETNQIVLGTLNDKVFAPGTYQAGQKTYTYTDETNVVLDARASCFHYVPVTNTCHLHFTNIFTGYSAIVYLVNAGTYAITLNTNQFKVSEGTQPAFTATTNALDLLYIVSDPWGTNVISTITVDAHN